MEHTQGKWIAKLTATGFCILAGKVYKAIAERHFDDLPNKQDLAELHANARLIAAAPDLLDACLKYVELIAKASQSDRTPDEIGRNGHELDAIMAPAIAKAEIK